MPRASCPASARPSRGQIDRWLSAHRLSPRIVGEFDDGALMKAFGPAGAGYFPGPALLVDEVKIKSTC